MKDKIINFFNKNSSEYKNKYYSKNIFHNYFFNSRLESLFENLPSNCDNILDIGHGTGDVYNYLKSKNITFNNFYGTDISSEMLNKSNISKNNKFCGDVWNSQFKIKKFNLILMIGVSTYMDKDIFSKNINFICDNCEINSSFIITVNNNKSIDLYFRKIFKLLFWYLLPKNSVLRNFTPHIYTHQYILNLLNDNNNSFILNKIERHNFTIFPFNLLFPKFSIFLGNHLKKLNLGIFHSDEILIFKKNEQ